MKILIKDYVSDSCSQSAMFYESIKKYTKISPYYWHHEEASTFDILDDIRPNFVLIDVYSLTKDLAYYLDSNQDKDIKLIIHIPESFNQIDNLMSERIFKSYTTAIITNKNITTSRSAKVIKILPSANEHMPNVKYSSRIPIGHVINSQNKIINETGSYHLLSHSRSIKADIAAPSFQLSKLYNNYDKIVFHDITSFEQPFFEAVYKCPRVFYNTEANLSEESIQLFGQDLNINNDNINFEEVKKTVETKHISKSRIKQFLSQLPINQSLFTEVKL